MEGFYKVQIIAFELDLPLRETKDFTVAVIM